MSFTLHNPSHGLPRVEHVYAACRPRTGPANVHGFFWIFNPEQGKVSKLLITGITAISVTHDRILISRTTDYPFHNPMYKYFAHFPGDNPVHSKYHHPVMTSQRGEKPLFVSDYSAPCKYHCHSNGRLQQHMCNSTFLRKTWP